MKAILEIEVPESCKKCPLTIRLFGIKAEWLCCIVRRNKDVDEYTETRDPDCILKIIGEEGE